MPLRPYQQRAFDSIKQHILESTEPIVAELATGAGKSHVISAVAEWIHSKSKKPVLVLQPSKELVEQNHSKYPTKASIYCASAGKKCLEHPVVFASPLSIRNAEAQNYAAIIVDECHGTTPTIKNTIDSLKSVNPKIRVIGLTATPYRMFTGYIFQYDISGEFMEQSKNPYYHKRVCQVGTQELIDGGYLTKPIAEEMEGYDTECLELSSTGKYTSDSVDKAFIGKGRLTSRIVSQVISMSSDRKGVMFFASTIKHAEEIMQSLPDDMSCMLTGKTPKKERNKIVEDFKDQKKKYIVNVSVLTTGFDATHVDVVAILRATESAGLFQQIIGRGLRIHDNKDNVLVLDYAENISRFDLEDNLFEPNVTIKKDAKKGELVNVKCPQCSGKNVFSKRMDQEYEGCTMEDDGYLIGISGRALIGDHGPVPSHYGRRCKCLVGTEERCTYRWTYVTCPKCKEDNDITARQCTKCEFELIDPNKKLIEDFKKMKSDPCSLSTDTVEHWSLRIVNGKSGECIMASYRTEFRKFNVWYTPSYHSKWANFCLSTLGCEVANAETYIHKYRMGHAQMPSTITVFKKGNYYNVKNHNLQADINPSLRSAGIWKSS